VGDIGQRNAPVTENQSNWHPAQHTASGVILVEMDERTYCSRAGVWLHLRCCQQATSEQTSVRSRTKCGRGPFQRPPPGGRGEIPNQL